MADESCDLTTYFWIGTEAYTDRDREMFLSGFEFHMIISAIERGVGWSQQNAETEPTTPISLSVRSVPRHRG